MATRSSKTTPASGTLKATLLTTRLKKISIDILVPPSQSAKGRLQLAYNIGSAPAEQENTLALSLSIEGKGVDSKDSSLVAFTIEAELMGLFSISRKPSKKEEPIFLITMANYIAPVLADTVETALSKCGFPHIKLARNFPEDIPSTEK